LAGEGWGEGVSLKLPPPLNPLPRGRGRFIFALFVQINMSILITDFPLRFDDFRIFEPKPFVKAA